MMIQGMHYSNDCLCKSCKQAGNRRYIGGGVYNENNSMQDIKQQLREEWDKMKVVDLQDDYGVFSTDKVADFWLSKLSLAVEQEKERVVAMVLKEIDDQVIHRCEFRKTQLDFISKNTLKEKLQAKQ